MTTRTPARKRAPRKPAAVTPAAAVASVDAPTPPVLDDDAPEGPSRAAQGPPYRRVVTHGDTGADVVWVQERLAAAGYDPGDRIGQFTQPTRRAVKRYQQDRGMSVTGEVNRYTYDAMRDDRPPLTEAERWPEDPVTDADPGDDAPATGGDTE